MNAAQDPSTLALIRTRLANDERALKRLVRAFYRLAGSDARADGEPAESADAAAAHVALDHADFTLELDALARTIGVTKGSRPAHAAARERAELERAHAALLADAEGERSRIRELKEDLLCAQRERAERVEYDDVARDVRRLAERSQTDACVSSCS